MTLQEGEEQTFKCDMISHLQQAPSAHNSPGIYQARVGKPRCCPVVCTLLAIKEYWMAIVNCLEPMDRASDSKKESEFKPLVMHKTHYNALNRLVTLGLILQDFHVYNTGYLDVH